jgi:hypothetical protein
LPDASLKINALPGPKSSTNIQCICKKSKEAKERRSRTYWQAVSLGHDLVTHQHAQAERPKEGKRKHLRNSIKHDISQRKSMYKEYKFPDWFLGKI